MKIAALPAAFALLLAPSCSQDRLAGVDAFAGDWIGTHKILGEDGEHAATYAVHREGDVLVWQFSSGFQGGFTGQALLRWDEKLGQFVEAWTDSAMPEAAMETAGSFDSKTGVMLMTGMAPDWTTGEPVAYQHETTLLSKDEWKYVMHQATAEGGFREVMWIHMRRK